MQQSTELENLRVQLDAAREKSAATVADMGGQLGPRALAQLAELKADQLTEAEAARTVGQALGEGVATLGIEVTAELDETINPPALAILAAIEAVKEWKPKDRSATARAYAVTITELEKAYAYFLVWAMEPEAEQMHGDNGDLPPVAS